MTTSILLVFQRKRKAQSSRKWGNIFANIQQNTELCFTAYTVRAQAYVGTYNYCIKSMCANFPNIHENYLSKFTDNNVPNLIKMHSNMLYYINDSSQAFPWSCFFGFRSQTSDMNTRQLIKVKFNCLWLRLGGKKKSNNCQMRKGDSLLTDIQKN